MLYLGLFTGFFAISDLNFRCLGFQNHCFHKQSIEQIAFSRESFSVNFGMHFCSLLDALGAVFVIFFRIDNTLEYEANFSVIKNLEFVLWRSRSESICGPQKT